MTIPQFFVPGTSDDDEAIFRALAEAFGCEVPPMDKRVYLIEWYSAGQRWTAEVGRQLRGVQEKRSSRGREGARFTDAATVQAIFPSSPPWNVVTDAPPIGSARSEWENPLLAGEPSRVEYFSAP